MVTIDSKRPNRQFWKGKRVLVTGDAGFKGSWLVNWLTLLQAEVLGIDTRGVINSTNAFTTSLNYQHLTSNLIDANWTKTANEFNPEIVFHLAAQPLVPVAQMQPSETIFNNVLSTLNLIQNFSHHHSKPIYIIASTDKVYSSKNELVLHVETDELGAIEPYSLSKVLIEQFLHDTQFQLQNNITLIRSGNVLGGGDFSEGRLLPDIYKSWKNQKKIELRNPRSRRPWVHVLDSLNGYILAAEYTFANPPEEHNLMSFNLAPSIEEHLTVEKLTLMALDMLKPSVSLSVEQNHAKFIERSILLLNADKARKQLGWHTRYSTSESVNLTFEWYKKHDSGVDSFSITRQQIRDYQENK